LSTNILTQLHIALPYLDDDNDDDDNDDYDYDDDYDDYDKIRV